jgi:hypothetical protein
MLASASPESTGCTVHVDSACAGLSSVTVLPAPSTATHKDVPAQESAPIPFASTGALVGVHVGDAAPGSVLTDM